MEGLKDVYLSVFKLVVTRDPKAVRSIKHAEFDISKNICFDFYKKKDWAESCDCWYVNEYFEYCSESRVDLQLFDTVLDNCKRGHCPHIVDQPPENVATTGVSLIHAACATNNKSVVRCLLKKDQLVPFNRTRSAGLIPAVIAVLKDSSRVIKSTASSVFSKDFNGGLSTQRGQTMRWANRDVSNGAVTFVKAEHFQNYSQQHPFVWCFFLNIKPSVKTIGKIVDFITSWDAHVILGHVLHVHDRQTTTDIASSFSQFVSNLDPIVAVQCILWNKPEALRIILNKTDIMKLDVKYSGFSLLSISEFLGQTECSGVLEEHFHKFRERKAVEPKRPQSPLSKFLSELVHQDLQRGSSVANASPFSCLIYLYYECKYSFGFERLSSLFSKISKNKFNINHQDVEGITAVHTALLTRSKCDVHCVATVLKILFHQGADINIMDKFGRSALKLVLAVYAPPTPDGQGLYDEYMNSYNTLKLFKQVLTQNAIPISGTVSRALERDSNNLLLKFVDDETVSVVLSNEGNKRVFADGIKEKILALSFAALLLELGFPVDKFDLRLFSKLPKTLETYLLDIVSRPITLKSRCRNVIRVSYPGPKLRAFLDSVQIPSVIADAILFKPYLGQTQIILNSGDIIDDVHTYARFPMNQ